MADNTSQFGIIPGELYRTPWEPSGLVRVLEIEIIRGHENSIVEQVGDHPKGYKVHTAWRLRVLPIAESAAFTPRRSEWLPPVKSESTGRK